jgi:tRNA G18 (ribose-2'-O)-methylase SpoU
LVFSKRKFLALSEKLQHKAASKLLKQYHETGDAHFLEHYTQIASSMAVKPLDGSFQTLSDRYHYHLKEAKIASGQHLLTSSSYQTDTLSNAPFLGVNTYLCNLRSAHNVGSILRTVEAFRLGSVLFSPSTPGPEHEKVKKVSMGCHSALHVEIMDEKTLIQNKRPIVAIELTQTAQTMPHFTFPKECTLVLGNEEYGVSEHILAHCDHVVKIPLTGGKHSLNVANAFAITAYEIIRQRFYC